MRLTIPSAVVPQCRAASDASIRATPCPSAEVVA